MQFAGTPTLEFVARNRAFTTNDARFHDEVSFLLKEKAVYFIGIVCQGNILNECVIFTSMDKIIDTFQALGIQ